MFKIRFTRLIVGVGVFLLAASSAQAFSTAMTSNYTPGTILNTGDTVTISVDFSSTGTDIAILSVSVLFNDEIMAWDQGASSSPTYALYNAGGRANVSLAELSTNMSLRAGTADQILLDWSSNALPSGTRDQCGDYGTYPAVPGAPSGNGCGFQMASLVFNVISAGAGEAAFTLSNSSPGNLFQLGDNTQPGNPVSGDFIALTLAACTGTGKTKRDFNCDGKSDMLFEVSTGSGENNLLRSVLIDGTQKLDVSGGPNAGYVGILFPDEHAIATAQADDDQNADIVTRYDTGDGLVTIRSTGTDGVSPGGVSSIRFMGSGGLAWAFVGVGDMDGNGVDDLVFRNTAGINDGLIQIILQGDGTEGWPNDIKYAYPGFVPSGYAIQAIGDMDGDGWADILVQTVGGQLDALMMVDGGSGLPVVEFPRSEVVDLAFYVMNDTLFPGTPGYNAVPGYAVTDAARFEDANSAADLILEGISNPIPGMVALIRNNGSRDGFVFDGITQVPDYILNPGADFRLGPLGNYDGLNHSDVSARNETGVNAGVERIVLQGADGVTRLGSGYPLALPLDYSDID